MFWLLDSCIYTYCDSPSIIICFVLYSNQVAGHLISASPRIPRCIFFLVLSSSLFTLSQQSYVQGVIPVPAHSYSPFFWRLQNTPAESSRTPSVLDVIQPSPTPQPGPALLNPPYCTARELSDSKSPKSIIRQHCQDVCWKAVEQGMLCYL